MTPAAKNKWALILVGAVFLVAAGSLVYWLLENHERRERTVRTSPSTEARRNPYLAAERYLTRLGNLAQGIRGRGHLKSPPSETGAMVVHDLGPSLPPEDEEQLLEWVEQGSHLVVVPRRVWDEDDTSVRNHLYERFGIRLRRRKPGDADGFTGLEQEETEREVLTIQRESADGSRHEFQLAFDPGLYLEDTASVAAEQFTGEHGPHMLTWKQGGGRITVLSDNSFMLNDYIGEHDHAWFVSDLLKRHNHIRFLADAAMPPLTRLLWRHAPEAALSSILLGFLWLWRAAATHGPRRRTGERVRRNIIEHLEAVAAFGWRRDPNRVLLDHSRSVVERQWRKRHPGLNRMDEVSRCAWIAARTGMKTDEVRSALYTTADDEQALIRTTAVQQKLTGILSNRADIIEEQS